MKKLYLVTALMIVASIILTACGAPATTAPTQAPVTSAPTEAMDRHLTAPSRTSSALAS